MEDISQIAQRPIVQTIVIGFSGALLAYLIGVPAPWLTGPAFTVSIAGIFGASLNMPDKMRDSVFVIIGMTMGAGVTPQAVATAARWPLSILTLLLALVLIIVAGTYLLRSLFRYNTYTALLSSTPGHLSYVLGLSTETNAVITILSIVQTMRVLALTLLVPAIVTLAYPEALQRSAIEAETMALWSLAVVGGFSVFLGLGLKKLRTPAALLLSGLIVSSFFHLTEIAEGIVPLWLTTPAFILMGTLIGTRFNGVKWQMLKKAFGASFVTTGIALTVSGAAALLVSLFVDMPPSHLLIAFAPGGLETMVAMGIMLDANPAFVAAHHISRILFLTAVIPILMKKLKS